MRLCLLLLLALLLPGAAAAQSWPTRPVRLVMPFPAGGASDAQARAFADALSVPLGQRVVVENRPGAGGNIGVESVMRAAPDGYTLLATGPNLLNTPYLIRDTPFRWERDFDALGLMFSSENVLVVHPSVPARTVPEFIAYLRANPGRVNYGSAGAGGSIHLAGLLFTQMTGTEMVHVPYRGDAPARTDLTSGTIQVMFNAIATSVESVRAGQWRALATTGRTRPAALPDLPTIQEAGLPGYEVVSWMGLYGPKGLPAPVVARIRQGFEQVFADPDALASFRRLDVTVTPSTPEAHVALMRAHEALWAPILSRLEQQ